VRTCEKRREAEEEKTEKGIRNDDAIIGFTDVLI